MTAQAAGLLTFLEPVAGAILAWALLDQPLAPDHDRRRGARARAEASP